MSETVPVQASALALQTEKMDLHVDLDAAAVTDLPLPRYRNYQSLINLVPWRHSGRLSEYDSSRAGARIEHQHKWRQSKQQRDAHRGALSIFI